MQHLVKETIMKTAAKVFIIIGMICQFYLVVPLIIGILALKKLNTATKKSELTGMAIATLILCNGIAGVLMLCMKDQDLVPATSDSNV